MTDLATLGVTPHPGYDLEPTIDSPIEAVAAATELVDRLMMLARLESRPRSNAAALLEHHAEAGAIAEQLRSFLLFFEVPA